MPLIAIVLLIHHQLVYAYMHAHEQFLITEMPLRSHSVRIEMEQRKKICLRAFVGAFDNKTAWLHCLKIIKRF